MLPPGAELLGRLSRRELYERMARAHCLLVPSVREGWGLVVVEANAVGTPAVGYDVRGIRDSIRPGETGVLGHGRRSGGARTGRGSAGDRPASGTSAFGLPPPNGGGPSHGTRPPMRSWTSRSGRAGRRSRWSPPCRRPHTRAGRAGHRAPLTARPWTSWQRTGRPLACPRRCGRGPRGWAGRFRRSPSPTRRRRSIAAIAVQTWFRGDAGLATGDLAPPVAPGIDYRAHWNGFDSGAGAPSYQIVSLPYFEGLRLFSSLGFGEVAFQRLWLTVLVAASAASVVFLARGLVRSPLAAAVAGFVPLFSAYRLTLAFDPVPLVAMIAAAVLGGLVIRAGGDSGPRPLVFGLASLSCALRRPESAARRPRARLDRRLRPARVGCARPRGAAARGAVPARRCAARPAVQPVVDRPGDPCLHGPGVHRSFRGRRRRRMGVDARPRERAQRRDVHVPLGVAVSRSTSRSQPASSDLPSACCSTCLRWRRWVGVALAVGRQRRVGVILLVVGVLAIWVMKGLHDPLAGINRWLYDAVPGFWLLRDPAKAGLVLALVFALLIALGIAALAERSRSAGTAAAVFVVAAAALYAHPLLTGAVVPSERPLLPSAHVRVPAGWEATAAYLESRPANGKVVVLPRLDYYQTPTTWGYYGASFLHSLIDRPVIEPVPAAYYRDAGGRRPGRTPAGGDPARKAQRRGLASSARSQVHRLPARPRHRISRAFAGLAGPAGEAVGRRAGGPAPARLRGGRRVRGAGRSDAGGVPGAAGHRG